MPAESAEARGVDTLVNRNVRDIWEQFERDPDSILVSVQIDFEQEAHLKSGLSGRSRRLVPLTLLKKMLNALDAK